MIYALVVTKNVAVSVLRIAKTVWLYMLAGAIAFLVVSIEAVMLSACMAIELPKRFGWVKAKLLKGVTHNGKHRRKAGS